MTARLNARLPGLRLCRALLTAIFALPAVATAADGFDELTVRLDHPVDASPISIRLADDAGLVAVGKADGEWRYSVVALGRGEVVATGTIPEGTVFYDTGSPLGGDAGQLCFFSERGVSAIRPGDGRTTEVVAIDSLYHGKPAEGPTWSDFVRDVDGDGADDVLAPLFDGWLVVRKGNGGIDQVKLGIPPRVTIFESGISYQPRQPRLGDVNGDGLNDLVYLGDREFVSFVQGPGGRFSSEGRRDAIDAPLASEEERARWERDDGQVDQSDLQIEEVEVIRDFDGDGILDILTEKEISEGVFDRRSEYHLYLGRREGTSLRYPAVADGTIASDGVQFLPIVVDVDGDGRKDVATPSTKLGLTRIVGALFSGRITVDLDVYRMRADGSFPEDSDYRTRFKVEFDLKTGLTRYPAIELADVDGDGLAELLVQEEDDELSLYPGVGAPDVFGRLDRTLSLPMPSAGDMVTARDLDDDGRADLVVRYGPADGSEFYGVLRVLMSSPAS